MVAMSVIDLEFRFGFSMVVDFEYGFGVVVDFKFGRWLGSNLGLGLNIRK